MNKYQEAFNELIEDYNDSIQQKSDLSDYYEWYGTQEKIDIIQELVDKETPMKPVIQEIGQYIIRYVGKCECGEFIARSHKYCHGCGQRLDWSEEDE